MVTSDRIETVGRGFYEPLADNDTPEGQSRNRRVEISVVGSVEKDSVSGRFWWNALSASKDPGYTVCFVPDVDIETVSARLEAEGVSDLVFLETSAGVAVVDETITYTDDGAPDSDSIERLKTIGGLLPLLPRDPEVRIGGYDADLSTAEIEERHFLTAYTLGAIAGFNTDAVTYSAAPYVLAKATAALTAGGVSTPDGTPVALEGKGTSFAATVPFSVDSLRIDLVPEDPGATITGLSEELVSLAPGSNEFSVTVESAAAAQTVSRSYRLTVVRRKPVLQSLSITADDQLIALSPEFSPEIRTYEAAVPYVATDVDVLPVLLPEDESLGATTSVEKDYTDTLNPGVNTVSVTLSDGSSIAETYTISVVREELAAVTTLEDMVLTTVDGEALALSPPFSPDITEYTVTVPYAVPAVSLNPLPTHPAAVLSRDVSEVLLSPGHNDITTVVTDQLGGNPTAYTLTIKRSAPVLSDLELRSDSAADGIALIPPFSPEITNYEAVVPYIVTDVDVLSMLLPEETALGVITSIEKDYTGSLSTGLNRIEVTLSDGASIAETYTISVVREKAAATTLEDLTLTARDGAALTLSPPFSPEITEYTLAVPYSLTAVTVTPLPTDAAALVDREISDVSLLPGRNEIATVVTDQLRGNPTAYTVTIERSAPRLSGLELRSDGTTNGITLVPPFFPETRTYEATVPYVVTDVDVLPMLLPEDVAVGVIASIEKDYTDTLSPGVNTIAVTLSDGSSTAESYAISVVRQEAAVTTLDGLALTSADGAALALAPPFSSDITEYTVAVPYSVTAVTVSPLPTDAAAVIDHETSDVSLSVGNNEISRVVTDQLGEHPTAYTVMIERSPPLLSDLELRLEGKDGETSITLDSIAGTNSYSVAVPYKTEAYELHATLSSEDIAAGATLEMLPEGGGPLPVGTTTAVVRIVYGAGETSDHVVTITRNEKEVRSFEVFGIGLIPGWYVTPAASFYTRGFGAKLSGGMTVRVTEDSDVKDAVRPLRLGVGAHIHGGTGNYLTILAGGAYLSTEYIVPTGSVLPDRWYLPKALIPRLDTGAAYYAIDYTEGRYREGAAFYVSPALRTDFTFPGLPNVDFGLDLSYTAYVCPVTVTYFTLGAAVSWE